MIVCIQITNLDFKSHYLINIGEDAYNETTLNFTTNSVCIALFGNNFENTMFQIESEYAARIKKPTEVPRQTPTEASKQTPTEIPMIQRQR